MSAKVRIIPRLDIKNQHLVKGIHLEGLRVLGHPEEAAKIYYQQGADELIFMDVVASLFGRNSLLDIISRTAAEVFIPMTVGGGIRTLEDIRRVLRAGADKVSINTAATLNPNFIKEASHAFGASTIVVAIEVIRQEDGKYLCFTDNGREYTGLEAVEWAQRAEELGAGEILLTVVNNEGTGKGLDLNFINLIASKLTIPVIAHGGVGKLEHALELFTSGEVKALALASMLHYDLIKTNRSVLGVDELGGNKEFLKSGRQFSTITGQSLREIKSYLVDKGVRCRL